MTYAGARWPVPRRLDEGGNGGGVPPLPIPNREVKPACADGTAERRESRQPPSLAPAESEPRGLFFLFPASLRPPVRTVPGVPSPGGKHADVPRSAFREGLPCLLRSESTPVRPAPAAGRTDLHRVPEAVSMPVTSRMFRFCLLSQSHGNLNELKPYEERAPLSEKHALQQYPEEKSYETADQCHDVRPYRFYLIEAQRNYSNCADYRQP